LGGLPGAGGTNGGVKNVVAPPFPAGFLSVSTSLDRARAIRVDAPNQRQEQGRSRNMSNRQDKRWGWGLRAAVLTVLALAALGSHAQTVGRPGVAATGGASATTCGDIAGGLAWDGVTRAHAVDFSGGGNTLTLENGATFTGLVVSAGGDALALGGDAATHCGGPGNGTFDLAQIGPAAPYRGFSQFAKTGASTWTLIGSNTAPAWDVNAGTCWCRARQAT
jgi:hypothetical protein